MNIKKLLLFKTGPATFLTLKLSRTGLQTLNLPLYSLILDHLKIKPKMAE